MDGGCGTATTPQESFKELAKRVTDKVVQAKCESHSYLMTEHTRKHVAELIHRVMHPHGKHNFVYDAARHRTAPTQHAQDPSSWH